MPTNRPNFHLITGGPGSGKTSLIEALRARGFRVVGESGRRIIQAQLAIGGNALHSGDRALFAELMLAQAIFDYESLGSDPSPAFFDRGIPDLVGYFSLIGLPVPADFRNAARLHRYSPIVFAPPPWEAIYRNDVERKQDFGEAVATFGVTTAACREAGYELVDLPKLPVAERVDFILA
jgi:predicted ATPase